VNSRERAGDLGASARAGGVNLGDRARSRALPAVPVEFDLYEVEGMWDVTSKQLI
jgi:hypothetical protein